jgi:hypothetical protein
VSGADWYSLLSYALGVVTGGGLSYIVVTVRKRRADR